MRISFIGTGNMAGAIIRSILKADRIKVQDICVFDKSFEKCNAFVDMGAKMAQNLCDAVDCSPLVLLAVKPQDYELLLSDIKNSSVNLDGKIFISIAAGISTDYVCRMLGRDVPVVRVMPNTPLLLGVGATAISRNAFVSDKDYSRICTLFAASGTVTAIDEILMNAVISVNSSSPVYLYMLADAMIKGAVQQGINEKMATELVFQTLKGSVEMLKKSGLSPDELIKMVASPGGTTMAAINTLCEKNFSDTVIDAMIACTNRADELSR